jgi:predicted GIY-YIG superfamily endonuclease
MESIIWKSMQKNSDQYLADGLWTLSKRPYQSSKDISDSCFGNYLITHEKVPYYIGEAKDICKRLRQQFKPATSTFYKNYQKYLTDNRRIVTLSIDGFNVQHMPTFIGRKEIEEFGIVNLPTILNSFQLGKRGVHKIVSFDGIWDELQSCKTELLIEGEKEIFKQSFNKWHDNIVPKSGGLYIVEDKSGNIIYIGESSDMNERQKTHSNRTYFSALRRHIATELLSFELKEKNGKKKYLADVEEKAVNGFLKECRAIFYPVNLGRYELEEYLIKKHKPLLNRKDNKD